MPNTATKANTVTTSFGTASDANSIAGMCFVYFLVLPWSISFFIAFGDAIPLPRMTIQHIATTLPTSPLPQAPLLDGDPPNPKPGEFWINKNEGRLKLYFDKESGLPVKLIAKVIGFGGDEFTQETSYSNYKDFDGAKKATKISAKRDGEKFVEQEITEFKVLDKAPSETFVEPK